MITGEYSNRLQINCQGNNRREYCKIAEKKMALADQIIGGEEMESGSFSKEELLELLKEL